MSTIALEFHRLKVVSY